MNFIILLLTATIWLLNIFNILNIAFIKLGLIVLTFVTISLIFKRLGKFRLISVVILAGALITQITLLVQIF